MAWLALALLCSKVLFMLVYGSASVRVLIPVLRPIPVVAPILLHLQFVVCMHFSFGLPFSFLATSCLRLPASAL
ncbi:hypothetical protein F5B20DRAFT_521360, partial [Whalleya microplaca]